MGNFRQAPLVFPLLLRRVPDGNQSHQFVTIRNSQELPYLFGIGLFIPRHPAGAQTQSGCGQQDICDCGAPVLQVIFGVTAEDNDTGRRFRNESTIVGKPA